MQLSAVNRPSDNILFVSPILKQLSLSPVTSPFKPPLPRYALPSLQTSLKLRSFTTSSCHNRRKLWCVSPNRELVSENSSEITSVLSQDGGGEKTEFVEGKYVELAGQSIWIQMVEIVKFSGPATGLWICGPLMSLIDTAVIGQGSSIELAALGPGTVLCDYMSYVFMFLSIATSNMVATSLARQGIFSIREGPISPKFIDIKGVLFVILVDCLAAWEKLVQDDDEVQRQISILLFVGLTCGLLMLLFTKFLGAWALSAFTGAKNMHLLPAANTYVQIRGLAWPALLVGWVAQSASLGMKDSWGPLKALAVASAVNGIGDIVLCIFLGYGIAGAAWATMVSQVIAAFMMIDALNKKGYNSFSISVPLPSELLEISMLAAPVFLTIASKVAFYTLLVYFATSMGTHTVAAHQVLTQTFSVCAVWGEPLSQTAQSFMPELMYGVNRSLVKARRLLKSLLIIGTSLGLVLGTAGTCIPWLLPEIFTPDHAVIGEMCKVLIPYFLALSVTPCTHCCEGTLLAGRDLKFISISMAGCFAWGSLLLLVASSRGFGLVGCWFALVGFQWARFLLALQRLLSPAGVLFCEDLDRYGLAAEPEAA